MKKWKKFQLKQAEYDDELGSFRAVFATMNVVDHDGDKILNGAFGKQKVRISAYGHSSWQGALPVGKGVIYEEGDRAIVEAKFFLSTVSGKEHYLTVKEMGDLQEWSFALPVIDYEYETIDDREIRVLKRIEVPEVSPVLMGAGINTQTIDMKQTDRPMKALDHIDLVVKEVKSVTERLEKIKDIRELKNKKISEETLSRMDILVDAVREAGNELKRIRQTYRDVLMSEFLRFQKIINEERITCLNL